MLLGIADGQLRPYRNHASLALEFERRDSRETLRRMGPDSGAWRGGGVSAGIKQACVGTASNAEAYKWRTVASRVKHQREDRSAPRGSSSNLNQETLSSRVSDRLQDDFLEGYVKTHRVHTRPSPFRVATTVG